jgi:hypothetical protein
MLLEVSFGEAVDKYSILEIKKKNISDKYKLIEIEKELETVIVCKEYIEKQQFLYNLLIYINSEIWDTTNIIKSTNIHDKNYPLLSQTIFELNQKRFRLKNFFNILFSSNLKEQKSYSSTYCKININNIETIYNKIPEINFLSIEYDYLIFEENYINNVKKIFNQPNIITSNNDNIFDEIILENYNIQSHLTNIFDLIPLNYISRGRLGDFIQVLSIINEKFYETGKKGIIYIRNDSSFSKGLQHTYNDTYDVIKSQRYIYDYKIYNNEQTDIDLEDWFNSNLLYKASWFDIFKEKYNIDWGKHKWFNIKYDNIWKDKVLINVMNYRTPINIDFHKLYNIFGSSLIFISFDKFDYDEFIKNTNLNIPNYTPTSFTDCCIAVNSCKLLVASLSGILTIGHACHKDRIIGLCGIGDDLHNCGFDKYYNNVYYGLA